MIMNDDSSILTTYWNPEYDTMRQATSRIAWCIDIVSSLDFISVIWSGRFTTFCYGHGLIAHTRICIYVISFVMGQPHAMLSGWASIVLFIYWKYETSSGRPKPIDIVPIMVSSILTNRAIKRSALTDPLTIRCAFSVL